MGVVQTKTRSKQASKGFCNAHKNTIVSLYVNARPSLSLPFQDINSNESISKVNKWKYIEYLSLNIYKVQCSEICTGVTGAWLVAWRVLM